MQAPRRLQLRRGNTAAVSSYLGAAGELIVNTDNNTLYIHDGVTVGGYATTVNVALINNQIASVNANITQANVGMQGYVDFSIRANIANIAPGYTNTNVKSYLGAFDGNIIPSANVTYSLGNITHQWRDLFVSNNTIYVGGVPLSIDATGNLTINGNTIPTIGYVNTAVANVQVDLTDYALNANVTAANIGMKGYVDQANTIQAAAITAANLGIIGYINQGNSIQSAQIASANIGMKGYVDSINTALQATDYQQQQLISNLQISAYSNINVASYMASPVLHTFGDSVIVTGNLTVQGNLFLNGNTTILNTNNLVISDNIIYFANANPANSLDIGISGHFTANGVYQHTGLVRQASSNSWKLFSNIASEPSGTIDFTNAVYDDLQLGNITSPTIDGINANAQAQQTLISSLQSNSSSQQSEIYSLQSNATAQQTTLNTLLANAATQSDLINSINANVTQANVGLKGYVDFANTVMKAYVDGQIIAANANVSSSGGTNYSNVNVAAYLSTATINTTGNITAQYISGNISVTGNVTGTSPNVTLQAGAYTSVFDNQGNVTLPSAYVAGNVSANYFVGNGALLTGIVSGGGTNYSNSNVIAYLGVVANHINPVPGDIWGLGAENKEWYSAHIKNAYIKETIQAYSGGGYSGGNAGELLKSTGSGIAWQEIKTVNGNSLFGNGDITISGGGSTYGDSNVASYLPTYTGTVGASLINSSGNILTTGLSVFGNTRIGIAGAVSGQFHTVVGNIVQTSSGGAVYINTTGNVLAAAVVAGAVTSTGTVAVNAATGITTNQTTFLLANATATTINMGGAATTIRMGTITSNVFVGGALGNASKELTLRAQGTWNIATSIDSNGGFNSPPYANQPVIGGSGTGMTANYNATGGYLTSVTIYNPGTGYQSGDVISVPGGLAGNSFVLTNYSSTRTGNSAATYTFGIDGNLTVPGNVTARNFIGTVLTASQTNITQVGILANLNVTGNVTVGNLVGTEANTRIIANAYVTTFDIYGNVTMPGDVIAARFIGDGSLLTGIVGGGGGSSYGNSNVAQYLQTGNISNISVAGNVTATYFLGNGALLTGITASSSYSNVQVATYLPTYIGSLGGNLIGYSGNVYLAGNIIVGPAGYTALPTTVAQFTGNANTYTQLNLQNISTGSDATAEYVATANNGTDTTFFVDMGIANSNYDVNSPNNSLGTTIYPNDSYLYAQGNLATTTGGNLAIGTSTAGKSVKIFAGGINSANIVATVSNTGVAVTGSVSATANVSAVNMTASGNVNVTGYLVTAGGYGNISQVNYITANNVVATANVTVQGIGVTMPNRPAVRINGSTQNIPQTLTANVNLKGNAVTVAYNQGNYYNTTTGQFVAPVAGIYAVGLNARVGTNNALNQIAILKNGNNTAGNVACFWESDTNTGTAVHFGVNGTIILAVGDYLAANILAGNVTFDQNDNWHVTYIG